MKLKTFVFTILLLGVFALKTQAKYYALVIGINTYKGSTWLPLFNARKDAEAIAKVLKMKYQFDQIVEIYDQQATRSNIMQDLHNLAEKLTEEDHLLIYFSGHGFAKSNKVGYWVPVDARTNQPYELLANTAIKDALHESKCKHSLLLIDACFSATIFDKGRSGYVNDGSEKYYQKMQRLKSSQAITSGGVETVPDGSPGEHSAFAKYVLKALQNNIKKYFDALELFQQIRIPVSNNANTKPRFGAVKGIGHEGGQFVFCQKKIFNKITIATGLDGGTFLRFGRDIAKICYSKKIPIQVAKSKGSLDNFEHLLSGKRDFAILQYDALLYKDRRPKKNKVDQIKMLLPLYNEEFHLVVRKESKVKTLADLKGKKVVIGNRASGPWVTAKRLNKLTKVKWVPVEKNFKEGLRNLMDGKVEAVFYVVGAPTKKLGNLTSGAKNFIRLLPIQHPSLAKYYIQTKIQASAYDWLDQDVPTFATKAILVSFDYKKGSEQYAAVNFLVKNILNKLKDLRELGHPKWNEVKPISYKEVPWPMHHLAEELVKNWWDIMNGEKD